jgi:hypothetical protein
MKMTKTKECRSCRSQIDARASRCPHCRKKQPSPTKGIALAILFCIGVVSCVANINSGNNSSPSAKQAQTKTTSLSSPITQTAEERAATSAVQAATTAQALPKKVYDGRGRVVASATIDEFINIAERRGNRVSLFTPDVEAVNFARRGNVKQFAAMQFARNDCGLTLHPMVTTALNYWLKQEPIQMAHELEVLRIESSFMPSAFCNIARAAVEDITQTFDNILFYPG